MFQCHVCAALDSSRQAEHVGVQDKRSKGRDVAQFTLFILHRRHAIAASIVRGEIDLKLSETRERLPRPLFETGIGAREAKRANARK